jgi:hypothetical protein
MKTPFKQLVASAAFAISTLFSSLGHATTDSINYSDLWWNASEPGWGMNVAQQANTLFATFFIYGDGGQAVWYSATMTLQSVGPAGQPVYGGILYQTSGTPIGQPYNPALQNYREVGTATLEFGGVANALLTYSVDGVAVAKLVERQTFAANSLVGNYIGGLTDVTFACRDPNRNGLVTTEAGGITVTQVGTTVTIQGPSCMYEGDFVQQGQVAQVDGRYECTNNAQGAVTFRAMLSEQGGIVGTYVGRDSSCEFRGNIGAMRMIQ